MALYGALALDHRIPAARVLVLISELFVMLNKNSGVFAMVD